MVDYEVIVISDSEDEEESIAVTETESIEHTVEWLDSPSHTIGSLEPGPFDDDSFDVLDQSFMDETEDDPCPFDTPKVSPTQKTSPSLLQ